MNKQIFSTRISGTYRPVLLLGLISLVISLITRFILLFLSGNIAGSFTTIMSSFFIGMLYDVITASFIIIPLLLQLCFTSEFIYSRNGKKWVFTAFGLLLCLMLFTSLIPKDYSRDLYKGLIAYILLRLIIFIVLLLAGPVFRQRWRNVFLLFTFAVTCFALFFNAASEFFFWNEFSCRYNFIAVDYLVYTNEVIGNIRESYPLTPIVLSIAAGTILVLFLFRNKLKFELHSRATFPLRFVGMVACIGVSIGSSMFIPPGWQYFSGNNYANELAGNGPYDFIQAFKNNELDFYKYYQTLPDEKAFAIVRDHLASPYSHFTSNDPFNIDRTINYPGPENKMNVVLISVESFDASFMASFGNKKHLTPYLDSIAGKGLLFTDLYASGTRTVRGLEALSLSIPPLPGQSLVKRPDNENMFSLGSVFSSKGYNVQYIYGGYSYFDNMNYFFSNNKYQVIDRGALSKRDIHYANIWGVADEDLFTLALREIDSNDHAHRPFFSHIMTVSNHRPYTYPEGRIDIPPAAQTREGAVKYTDYCIGKFLEQASHKSWFNRTVFVIVADHCASSAGKTALPVTGYHIPMIIYSPENLHPGIITTLTAQIDIAPTILGLLQMDYQSKFFGRDVLHDPVNEARAFISTYQGLGFLKGDTLIVNSPVRQRKSFRVNFTDGSAKEISVDKTPQDEATAFYQVAAWLVKHKKYSANEGLTGLKY